MQLVIILNNKYWVCRFKSE